MLIDRIKMDYNNYGLRFIFMFLTRGPWGKWLPDKLFLKLRYFAVFGKKLDLKNPKTFNEKLQWLKLNNHNSQQIALVDKYEVKKIFEKSIGSEYIIPTIGVWNKFEDIDIDRLPNQFVLKCTHDSGGLVICTDKKNLNLEKTRQKITASLKNNFFYTGREWPYKYIKPRIIAEQYLNNNGRPIDDYKLHCFNGKVKFILVCKDRYSERGLTEDFYDIEWKHLSVRRVGHPNSREVIQRPASLDKMIELAEKLAFSMPFVRVDFYEVEGNVFFGEETFYPASGFEKFIPSSFDSIAGKWIEINEEIFNG